jgi:hypothetical protein
VGDRLQERKDFFSLDWSLGTEARRWMAKREKLQEKKRIDDCSKRGCDVNAARWSRQRVKMPKQRLEKSKPHPLAQRGKAPKPRLGRLVECPLARFSRPCARQATQNLAPSDLKQWRQRLSRHEWSVCEPSSILTSHRLDLAQRSIPMFRGCRRTNSGSSGPLTTAKSFSEPPRR